MKQNKTANRPIRTAVKKNRRRDGQNPVLFAEMSENPSIGDPALFQAARKSYHRALLESGVLCMSSRKIPRTGHLDEFPSNADGDSATSISIAQAIFSRIKSKAKTEGRLARQMAGKTFEQITLSFVQETFKALKGIRPGRWDFNPEKSSILQFEQYRHLAELTKLAKKSPGARALLGSDNVIGPDIIVVREPDELINAKEFLGDEAVAYGSGTRRNNGMQVPLASVSCKWTLCSYRGQNAQSEALNLMSNRRARVRHIVVTTGEPLPSRLATLALGTTDIDCVYHFALPELIASVNKLGLEDSAQLVKIMVNGRRLKDIGALPFDLAV